MTFDVLSDVLIFDVLIFVVLTNLKQTKKTLDVLMLTFSMYFLTFDVLIFIVLTVSCYNNH